MTINQKIEQEYFDHIVAGEKREIRLAADAVREGDTVILEECTPTRRNIPVEKSKL